MAPVWKPSIVLYSLPACCIIHRSKVFPTLTGPHPSFKVDNVMLCDILVLACSSAEKPYVDISYFDRWQAATAAWLSRFIDKVWDNSVKIGHPNFRQVVDALGGKIQFNALWGSASPLKGNQDMIAAHV